MQVCTAREGSTRECCDDIYLTISSIERVATLQIIKSLIENIIESDGLSTQIKPSELKEMFLLTSFQDGVALTKGLHLFGFLI